MPRGIRQRDPIIETFKQYPGQRITQNDLWLYLPDSYRRNAIAHAGSEEKAFRSTMQIVNDMSKNQGLRGLETVERGRGGTTAYRYTPPAKTEPFDEEKLTFTRVGFTSDGLPLYRDDRNGQLGWFEWKEL